MQIVDNTPQSYAPLLKETLRELLECAPPRRVKGIRLVVFEVGGSRPVEAGVTTRYSYKDGQGVVHVELDAILRLAGGVVPLEWRIWRLGRRAAHALSAALANHALRGGRSNPGFIGAEARHIQLELMEAWSGRWIGRATLPSFVKRLLSRIVAYRLEAMARPKSEEKP